MKAFFTIAFLAMFCFSCYVIKQGFSVVTELKAKQQQTIELIAKGN